MNDVYVIELSVRRRRIAQVDAMRCSDVDGAACFLGSPRELDSEWQRAIDSERLRIVLPADASIDGLRGYLPVHHYDKQTGFECHHYNATEMMAFCQGVNFGHAWTQCLCFIWGSDFDEALAASMASAAYAKATDGIVYDPQDDVIMSPREALDARQTHESELPKAKQMAADVAKTLSNS